MKRTRDRGRVAALTAIAILGLSLPFLVVPAVAAATISGVVKDASGAFLSGVKVEAYAVPATSLSPTPVAVTSTTTNGTGTFSLPTSLPSGKYQLRAYHTTSSAVAPSWIADTPSGGSTFRSEARVFIVTSSTSDTDLEITLGETGSISGTVPAGWKVNARLWNPHLAQFDTTAYQASTSGSSGRATYSITGMQAGEYLVQFQPTSTTKAGTFWSSKTRLDDALSVTVKPDAVTPNIDEGSIDISRTYHRVAGTTRYDASAQMSQLGFPDPDTVFIVNGENFPDGLAAAPAAAALGAPVLLTKPDTLPVQISAELTRLAPSTVVVVGGSGSVSSAVQDQIGTLLSGETIVRVEGANRYDGSRKLARYAFSGYDNHTAFMVIGSNFPDGIAAGSSAAALHAPVLLDNGASSVDAETIDLINDLDIERIVIVGGTGGIPTAKETALRAVTGITSVIRLAGSNRFNTSSLANNLAFPTAADTVLITTGDSYTDALSGITLAAAWGSPMMLSDPRCLDSDVRTKINALRPREIQILGGNNTLSVEMEKFTSC